MTLEEAIKESRNGIGNQCTHYHEDVLRLVLDAAEKWAAWEWWGYLEDNEAMKWFKWMKQNCVGLDSYEMILLAYRASQEGKD